MSPSNSIRERIFQDLKTTIQGINGGTSYFYKIDRENVNIIHGSKNDTDYREPYVYLYPAPEDASLEKAERGKQHKTLIVDIEAWVRSDNKTEMNTNINRMLHDLEKALLEDPERGGLAVETRMVSSDTVLTDLVSPKCAVMVRIEILYQHQFGNPSSLTV